MTYYKVLSESEYLALENSATEPTYGTAIDGKFYWDHNSTLLLLSFIRNRFDDLSHPVRRKTVWDEISSEMNCNSVQVSAKSCWQKYKSLIRSYNQAKDDRDKTRRFQFYEQMVELMAMKPTPPTVTVPQNIEMDLEETTEIDVTVKQKNAKSKVTRQSVIFKQSVEAKTTYYREKRRYVINKDKREEKKLVQQMALEEKKVRIMEKKVELEKRKLDILTESLRVKQSMSEITDK